MTNTVYPSGLTPTGVFDDAAPESVGCGFTVTVDTVIDGIYVNSRVAQTGMTMELWNAGNRPEHITADLAEGENFFPFTSPFTLLESAGEYQVSYGQVVAGQLHYWTTPFAPQTQGNFVWGTNPGRVAGAPDTPPGGTTFGGFYGAGVYVGDSAPTEISVTTTPPVDVTDGHAATLTAVAHDGSGSRAWLWSQTSGPDDLTITNATSAIAAVTPDQVGAYVFGVTVTDDTGTATGTVTVNATEAPVAALSNEMSLRVGDAWKSVGFLTRGNRDAGVIYVEEYGAVGDGVTDDTDAINDAVAAAVEEAVNANHVATVRFQPKTYIVGGPLIQGGATLGNSQLPIPVIDDTGMKLSLKYQGVGDASVFNHWYQTVPQASGTVLRTTLTGLTPDGTWGNPSMIGGPTVYVDEVDGSPRFSNMMFGIDGIMLQAPFNPSIIALNLQHIGEVNIGNLGILADAAVAGSPSLTTIPTDPNGYGLIMPLGRNNARSQIHALTVEGFYYGASVSEHLNATEIGTVYCDTGIYITGIGSVHMIVIGKHTSEACNTDVHNGADHQPISIRLDSEAIGDGHIHIRDDDSGLFGDASLFDLYQDPKITGGKNLTVTNLRQPLVGSYVYNADGTLASDPDGQTYTYNPDGTLHATTLNGVARTYLYNPDGTIASVV